MLLIEFLQHSNQLTESFLYMLLENRLDFLYNSYKEKLQDRFSKDTKIPNNYKQRLGDGDVAKNLIDFFSDIDPTKKKIYVQWMINLYLVHNTLLEDFEKLREGLKLFDKFKSTLDIKDINQFKSINQLLDVTDELKDKEDPISGKQREKELKKGAKFIINKPNFKVLIPETEEASCLYGSGTRWCTAANTNNMFDHYSKDGPLYIIIAGSGKNAKKFQLHYESNKFLNAKSADVSKSEIDYLSGFPEYKEFLNMLIKKHYSKYFK